MHGFILHSTPRLSQIGAGANRDPVTGGTHTFLTGYWSHRLGKTKMKSFQSSERTGSMEVELEGDQVLIRGRAVIVFEGRMGVLDSRAN